MVDQLHPSSGDHASRVDAVVAALRGALDDPEAHDPLDGQTRAYYLDDLTGTLTRGAGRKQLAAEVERAHRSLSALALVFADVDGLKTVNDTRGHAEGDRLLVAVTSALQQSMRQYDLVVRYGGDEFLCAMPGGGNDSARAAIQRARQQLETTYPGGSFSAGFAELLPDEQLDELICRADEDLYGSRARRVAASPGPRAVPTDNGFAPPTRKAPGVACAACGERIPLTIFVLVPDSTRTRSADCPRCAQTTLIQLRDASSS
jgi:diguanylate cyclase (GGDEF)-like protein